MKTDIKFQYLAPGALRPDDRTLPDAAIDVGAGSLVPAVGDIVSIFYRDSFDSYKVLARNFVYGYSSDGMAVGCTVFITVGNVDGNEVGVDIKE